MIFHAHHNILAPAYTQEIQKTQKKKCPFRENEFESEDFSSSKEIQKKVYQHHVNSSSKKIEEKQIHQAPRRPRSGRNHDELYLHSKYSEEYRILKSKQNLN